MIPADGCVELDAAALRALDVMHALEPHRADAGEALDDHPRPQVKWRRVVGDQLDLVRVARIKSGVSHWPETLTCSVLCRTPSSVLTPKGY